MDAYNHHHPWKSQSEIMYRSKSFLFKYDVDSFSSSSSQRLSNGVFMSADVDEEEEAGLSLAIPFTWESQPGTPKVMWLLRDGDQPPLLTPPPYCTPARAAPPPPVSQTKKTNNPRKKGFLRYIFPRFSRSRKKDNSNSL